MIWLAFSVLLVVLSTSVTEAKVACGVRNTAAQSHIIGGSDANPHELPWMVQIWFTENDPEEFWTLCAGTIVSERWVITAAHCTNGGIREWYHIYVGAHRLIDPTERTIEPAVRRMAVEEFYPHPKYSDEEYDLMLVKLMQEIPFDQTTMAPICLPEPTDIFYEETCVAAGWGYCRLPEGFCPTLQKIDVPIWNKTLCDAYLSAHLNTTQAANVLCTGWSEFAKDSMKGATDGDSGGPIACSVGDRYVLSGVHHGRYTFSDVEWNISTPGKEENVAAHIEWIKNTTKGVYFKAPKPER